MTTIDFISELFIRVDDTMYEIPKHPQAKFYPSEVVTIGILFALKKVGNRTFYRWLTRDYLPLFPKLPGCSRLFRLLRTHKDWTDHFLAEPTILKVADTYGIELLHPIREGRTNLQIGKKGQSNHRWIVGGKLLFLANQFGLVVDWDTNTGVRIHLSAYDPTVRPKSFFRYMAQTLTILNSCDTVNDVLKVLFHCAHNYNVNKPKTKGKKDEIRIIADKKALCH